MNHNNSSLPKLGDTINTNTNKKNDDPFEIDADLMEAVNSIVDEQEANEHTDEPSFFPGRDTTEITELKSTISEMKQQIEMLTQLLHSQEAQTHPRVHSHTLPQTAPHTSGEIIEGVFDGQKMIAEDGRSFPVPPNYASKSKLVEGDMMKLTITPNGSFVYKQIGPTDRKRLRGELLYDPESTKWSVLSEGRTYKVLSASVTFYKGKPGDQVTILVPQNGESEWGAVENIITF